MSRNRSGRARAGGTARRRVTDGGLRHALAGRHRLGPGTRLRWRDSCIARSARSRGAAAVVHVCREQSRTARLCRDRHCLRCAQRRTYRPPLLARRSREQGRSGRCGRIRRPDASRDRAGANRKAVAKSHLEHEEGRLLGIGGSHPAARTAASVWGRRPFASTSITRRTSPADSRSWTICQRDG